MLVTMIAWAHCDCRSVKVRDFLWSSDRKKKTQKHTPDPKTISPLLRGELVFEGFTVHCGDLPSAVATALHCNLRPLAAKRLEVGGFFRNTALFAVAHCNAQKVFAHLHAMHDILVSRGDMIVDSIY